jgi:3-oxoacyl-[acyl-carrier-protein] synthase II
MDNEIVITGMGSISPHGAGVAALWQGLLAGRAAFTPITLFDASMFRNPLAGVVPGYPALERGAPCRALRMLQDAAREALRDTLGLSADQDDAAIRARLAADEAFQRGAIVAGTNFGGMSAAETALVEGARDAGKASLDGYLFGSFSEEIGRAHV